MKGTIAAGGMALASTYIISEPEVSPSKHTVSDPQKELARFRLAKSECHSQIENLINDLSNSVDSETAIILDFQLLLLEDNEFIGKIEKSISADLVNAEYATQEVSSGYVAEFDAIADNDYLKERAHDVTDLSQRLISILSGDNSGEKEPDKEYIAIGIDIAPSRIAELDKSKLKGIILEKGGMTSHCVILSRSLGIPCLIGVDGIVKAAMPEKMILLDAVSGEVILDPDDGQISIYNKYKSDSSTGKNNLQEYINRETKTLDGARLGIFANITSADESLEMLHQGAEGVGLFRSELLFMSEQNSPPSEEKQYLEYSKAAKTLGQKPLIIRTLDVGGDKQISYLDIGKEDNPFLGYRAIRYCLDHPEIFKPQISAILRAGTVGNVRMMFPMITCVEEIIAAKLIVEQVKNDLRRRSIEFNENMRIGIMIETPVAAFDAEFLAKEVDFFSIGTNDLSQYLFAADRANTRIVSLGSHFQPALLRTISSVVDTAHQRGIEVDICGQAAEIDELIPLWVSMGVDNLSVSIPRITSVRKKICNLKKSDCDKLLDSVLKLDTARKVENELLAFLDKR